MKKISTKIALFVLFLGVILSSFLILSHYPKVVFYKVKGIEKFNSPEDFKNYLRKAEKISEYFERGYLFLATPFERALGDRIPQKVEELPERVSETTVQVPGIDEPDIVKTDGKEIYFSPQGIWRIWFPRTFIEKTLPLPQKGKTKLIRAFPPKDLVLDSEIKKAGSLLLIRDKKILVILGAKEVSAFKVSDSKNPEKKWEMKLEEKTQIVTSRLYQGKIYLITQSPINEVSPCPIVPLKLEGKEIKFKCSEIYHPIEVIPVDTTFFAMVLDPVSGKVEKKIAFVGSSKIPIFQLNSVVYMSPNSLYITYHYYESLFEIFSKFVETKAQDLFPDWMKEKIRKLRDYDISEQAKILELQILWKRYYFSLEKDERLRIENELQNRFSDFMKEKMREFEKTGIVKINLEKFKIVASNEVPGTLLNQFSLDEYKGNLRVAVTVGERSFRWEFGWERQSANDVYILDENLEIIGKIQDLGLRERIYSARFIQDKGYLVTFRQIDPFYVLDLSDPKNPELKGELKIPGYSSYLHPITKDKILGIGKEGWKVKISLFDVSNPKEPREIDKYILDDSWSEVLKTHHAFLLDKKHQIFFLPGSKGGYIFSYKEDKIELKKAVSQISAKRAIYIEDFLYIIGDQKITVLDEKTWERVSELSLI